MLLHEICGDSLRHEPARGRSVRCDPRCVLWGSIAGGGVDALRRLIVYRVSEHVGSHKSNFRCPFPMGDASENPMAVPVFASPGAPAVRFFLAGMQKFLGQPARLYCSVILLLNFGRPCRRCHPLLRRNDAQRVRCDQPEHPEAVDLLLLHALDWFRQVSYTCHSFETFTQLS